MEAALSHVVRNKVEAAYARSDLFERRRILMDDWAAYLSVLVFRSFLIALRTGLRITSCISCALPSILAR